MLRYILTVAFVAALGACATVNSSSPYTETAAICDNTGLESQLVGLRDQSRSTRAALGLGNGDGLGAGGLLNDQTDVERAYVLRDKLNRFEAEVDVLYRNITSSCKVYARCMEMRGYDENACKSSAMRWANAEASFTGLTREIREIDAEVEKLRIMAKKRRSYKKGPQLNRNDECDCSDSVGGVFANCCHDDRSRHRGDGKRH